ncbi:hypothetical protein F4804DRAFT_233358 [Jackrogersella minutella]|nr:hypothetical protein F4804DRAFT_233358 [Jackrogersella minutella]
MPQLLGLVRALYPAALLLAATASGSFIRADSLLAARADASCGTNFSPCAQGGLPADFCCETGSTCQLLAANTTVLCCPQGSSCDVISPITCDLGLQDASTNPAAEIKTTVLDGALAACGSGKCCPYGYHCDGTNCAKDADQSKRPVAKPTTTTSSKAPAATTSKSSTTVAVSGIATAAPETTEAPAASTTGTANTVTIIGGVIGGVAGLVLIILAVAAVRYRRKKAMRQEQKQKSLQRQDSSSSFGNIISNPVPHANYPSQRLDFLAKTARSSPAPSSPTAVASPRSHRKDSAGRDGGNAYMPPNSPYSPYARRPDSEMSDAPRSYHGSAEIRSLTHFPKPGAPPPTFTITPAGDDGVRDGARGRFGERDRYPSSQGESINIFADPLTVVGGAGGRPESAATTWSNIQQRADNANAGGGGKGKERLGESPLRRW